MRFYIGQPRKRSPDTGEQRFREEPGNRTLPAVPALAVDPAPEEVVDVAVAESPVIAHAPDVVATVARVGTIAETKARAVTAVIHLVLVFL